MPFSQHLPAQQAVDKPQVNATAIELQEVQASADSTENVPVCGPASTDDTHLAESEQHRGAETEAHSELLLDGKHTQRSTPSSKD